MTLHVSSITETPAPKYAKEIYAAKTRADLERVIRSWQPLAPDALEVVRTMDDAAFDRFRVGIAKGRKKQYAGDEWAAEFGAIIVPEKMLRATMVAERFKVPWGLAWLRLKQTGEGA